MSADFTPGPWLNGGDHVYAPNVTGEVADNHKSVGYKGFVVAESCGKQDLPLIAAAPDLLAACEAVLADGYQARAQVEVAIAKARGK